MARLDLSKIRTTALREVHLGKVMLFCEGHTEENYFDYFANIINSSKHKFSEIEIIPILAGGDARRVLSFADDFLADDSNSKRYALYEKFLIFDCDAPENILTVIQDMENRRIYELLPSNLLFEVWLLMHMEAVERNYRKKEIYEKMAVILSIPQYSSDTKNSKGMIAKIIGNGDNIRYAIENAKALRKIYTDEGLKISKDIENMNPYTSIDILVEQILLELSQA